MCEISWIVRDKRKRVAERRRRNPGILRRDRKARFATSCTYVSPMSAEIKINREKSVALKKLLKLLKAWFSPIANGGPLK